MNREKLQGKAPESVLIQVKGEATIKSQKVNSNE